MKSAFSLSWKRSSQRRKQRKYAYNVSLHTQQKFMHVHLSKELREKYGKRNIGIRKGDKVKILRGSHKGKTGKVGRVSLKYEKIYVEGIENIKKQGEKTMYPLKASNLMIIELDLDDKKRKKTLGLKKEEPKKAAPKEKPKVAPKKEEKKVEVKK